MKNLTSESLVFRILLIALLACGCFRPFILVMFIENGPPEWGSWVSIRFFHRARTSASGDAYLLPMHPYNSDLITHVGGLGMSGIRVGFFEWNLG